MKMIELVAPCHFGMEAVLKREILDLGYEISQVEDGRVTFLGDLEAVAYANVFLRTTERILIKVGKIHAETFDELFEGTKALPWEDFIPEDGKFWVAKANSIKSKLFSPSDIQSIMKKAMVERLKTVYHRERFEETGAEYPIRVSILKDEVLIGLDTSGVSLHKRGYRQMTAPAPITETLASALILFTPWKKDRILVDPFCGSGTFPIEAAEGVAHLLIESRKVLFLLQTLAVGRICDDKAVLFRMGKLGHRALLEMDQMIHTGHFSVGPGRLDDLAVDVVTLNIGLH